MITIGGKQERGGPLGATSSWVEGTQRAMKEELVDQPFADHLKRSEQSLSSLIRVADGNALGPQNSEIHSMIVC